jgi:hypothetical protein
MACGSHMACGMASALRRRAHRRSRMRIISGRWLFIMKMFRSSTVERRGGPRTRGRPCEGDRVKESSGAE